MAQRIVVDPDHPHRRPSAHRGRAERRQQDHPGLFLRHHGAGHRDHPEGARPARGLGFRPARLRGVHHRALLRLDPLGGGCAGHPNPEGGQPDPQPDDRPAVRPRSRDALLSPACPGLGGCGRLRSRRIRPRRRDIQQSISPWPNSSPAYFADVQKKVKAIVEQRPAVDFRQRLLGTPGLQASTGNQPPGRGPLPGSAGLAEDSPRSTPSSAARIPTPISSWAAFPCRSI